MSVQPDSYPKGLLSIPYSNLTPLNTLDIHLPQALDHHSASRYWIMYYIHGGAYRDPLITSQSILPTLPYLFASTTASAHLIAGVVSINYRLSPYLSHHTNPSSPSDGSRNVKHPAHIRDTLTAIKWLQRKYGFGERYLLVGHSCGATLAMQVVMGSWSSTEEDRENGGDLQMPMGVVGAEGIYDLRLLRDTHLNYPVYQEFIEGAFGKEGDSDWAKASPTQGRYARDWTNGRVVVLAHSKEDELVDREQVEAMRETLGKEAREMRRDVVLELKGNHDEVWEKGIELARAIEVAVKMLEG